MTAWRNMSSVSAGVNVLHTHGTVVVGRVLDTFVRLVTWQTQATRVTMMEIITSTNPELQDMVRTRVRYILHVQNMTML